jgi:hypothetical protein
MPGRMSIVLAHGVLIVAMILHFSCKFRFDQPMSLPRHFIDAANALDNGMTNIIERAIFSIVDDSVSMLTGATQYYRPSYRRSVRALIGTHVLCNEGLDLFPLNL